MAEQFDAVDIIRTKRDGGELTTEQINWVIDAYTRGAIGDEQMAALNMAIFIRDMNRREIVDWTKAMINSGETMDFSALGKKTTDKHSTGGVGDKLSLPTRPTRGKLRPCSAYALRTRTRPHRRHPRQARSNPRL